MQPKGSAAQHNPFHAQHNPFHAQRGPTLPCNEELSPPRDPREVRVGYVLLALAPLLLVPYPLELVQALSGLSSPVPVPLI